MPRTRACSVCHLYLEMSRSILCFKKLPPTWNLLRFPPTSGHACSSGVCWTPIWCRRRSCTQDTSNHLKAQRKKERSQHGEVPRGRLPSKHLKARERTVLSAAPTSSPSLPSQESRTVTEELVLRTEMLKLNVFLFIFEWAFAESNIYNILGARVTEFPWPCEYVA